MYKFKTYFYAIYKRLDLNNSVPIYCRLSCNNSITTFSTGIRVPKNHWNQFRQRLNVYSELDQQINRQLDQFKAHIHHYHYSFLEKGKHFTSKDIKKCIINHENPRTLIGTIKSHNSSMKKQIGVKYSKGTLKNYKTLLGHVKRFLAKEYNSDLALNGVEPSFVYRFESYLLEKTNCQQNGAMKVLQNLKKIITRSLQKGYIDDHPFKEYKFQFKKTQREFLTIAELKRFSEISLEDKTLCWIRKMFLFSCFTGLSYSDVVSLHQKDIVKEDNGTIWIKTYREKTGGRSNIPLLPPALKCIEKPFSKALLFRPLTLQAVNRGLKQIAKKAEINKKLSTHIARHTFATTITLSNDVPIETISKMLGHSRIQTTQIYARVLDKKVEHDMSKLNAKFNF